MHPSAFEYYAPTKIDEVLGLLSRHGEEAKIMAGGQSLIPLLKLRLASYPYIIDISQVEGMSHVKLENKHLKIGALVTIGELEENKLLNGGFRMIREAASQIADPQVRNRGTIGGNMSHGDPSNDMPAVMIALGAKLLLHGPNGERTVDSDAFVLDTFTTALQEGEILREISIPVSDSVSGGCYIKQKRNAGDFSVAAIALHLSLEEDERVKRAGIGLTSVGPKPLRARKAEHYLKGKKISDSVVRETAKMIVEESDPATDFYGTAEFKRKILERISEDAVNLAFERTLGGR